MSKMQHLPALEVYKNQPPILDKVYVWRGAVRHEVFGEVWGKVFGKVFGLVLLGHSEQNVLQLKLQRKIHTALHNKIDENSGRNFVTRFCRGAPAKPDLLFFGCSQTPKKTT